MYWEDVIAEDQYKQQSPEKKREIRDQYFNDVVAPQLDSKHIDRARKDFYQDTVKFEPGVFGDQKKYKDMSTGQYTDTPNKNTVRSFLTPKNLPKPGNLLFGDTILDKSVKTVKENIAQPVEKFFRKTKKGYSETGQKYPFFKFPLDILSGIAELGELAAGSMPSNINEAREQYFAGKAPMGRVAPRFAPAAERKSETVVLDDLTKALGRQQADDVPEVISGVNNVPSTYKNITELDQFSRYPNDIAREMRAGKLTPEQYNANSELYDQLVSQGGIKPAASDTLPPKIKEVVQPKIKVSKPAVRKASVQSERFNDPIDRMESHIANEVEKGNYTYDNYLKDPTAYNDKQVAKLSSMQQTVLNKRIKSKFSDDTIDAEVNKLIQQENERLEYEGLARLSGEQGFEAQAGSLNLNFGKKLKEKSIIPFDSPETEALFQSAKGIKPAGILQKLKTAAIEIGHKFSRTYEHLPRSGQNSQLIFDLKYLEKQKDVVADRTVWNIGETLSGLNKSDYDVFSRKVILDDLISDVNRGLYKDKELPFKLSPEALSKEAAKIDNAIKGNPKLQEALTKRQAVWDKVKAQYIEALKPYKPGVEDMFKENYYRHQVLDYVDNNGIFGTGKRMRPPTNKGYAKERSGYSGLYNTDFLESEHQIMAQMLHDAETAKTLTKIQINEDISKQIKGEYAAKLEDLMENLGHTKEQLRYGMKKNEIPDVAYINTLKSKIDDLSPDSLKKAGLEDWHKLIPKGYTAWQPKEGNIFYPAMTIPESTAEKIMSGELENVVDIAGKLKEVLAVGGKKREWVVRQEVADTLNNLVKEKAKGIVSSVDLGVMNAWKKWQLISPRRFIKYNIRNLTGDAEATFLGNASGFKKTPQAVKELSEVFFNKKPMSDDMKAWFERGGMSSTLQAQEMDGLKQIWMYSRLYEKKGGAPNLWNQYWKKARLSTDFREAILRYANYLDYKDQLVKGNGIPRNFGASKPEMINALTDINDKAFWLSNDLLGAYDQISVAGQTLRERAWPFWSWKEVNTKRYIQLYRNAANDGDLALTIGKQIGAKTPVAALKIGRLAIKTAAFTSMLHVYNHTMFPEEEKKLPKDIKDTPHIILGKDSAGNIQYFNRMGTLHDFISWFGLDAAPRYVNDYLSGKKTLKELLKAQGEESLKAPINEIAQGVAPMTKLAYETMTRRSTFPDIFKPGTIRDKALNLARSFGLENEYKVMAGLPSKGYGDSIKDFAIYKIDPGEAAYRNILDLKNDFLTKNGKTSEGFWLTPTGDAYYNIKLSLKYKDKEAFSKYFNILVDKLKDQTRLQDIEKSINSIVTSMNPLNGMNEIEQAKFIASLDSEGKETLKQANEFYTRNLGNIKDMDLKIGKAKE